jgi:transposase
MSKQRTRRQFTAEQKAAILKRHLADKVPVSDLCDEYQLQPSLFYEWQRKLIENAAVALEGGRSEPASKTRQLQEQIAHLEGKLAKKDSVMAELLSEYVALKKERLVSRICG